jgi:DNA-binding IclR family transcriptional regulator
MDKSVSRTGPPADATRPRNARDGGGVQSIRRAFSILEEIARHRDGITLAELSRSIGLHNSTTFHLVRTLASLGYVHQLRDSKKYRIGRRLFTLAASSLDELELINTATPVLAELSRATGESAHLAIRSGDDVVVIAKTTGAGAFQLAGHVGVVRPAHCTALGKVLLAAMPESELESHLRSHALASFTSRTIVDVEALLREIDKVRRSGVAFDDGEFNVEIRCVAVPVHDLTGRVTAAIGVSGPIWRLSLQALAEKSRHVREAAMHLSQEFGFCARRKPAAAEAFDKAAARPEGDAKPH